MKRIVIGLLIAAMAGAATQITFNVPNNKAQDILTTFTAQQDSAVTIQVQGSQGAGNPGVEDYSLSFTFRTYVRDPNDPNDPNDTYDTNEQFTKKSIGRIVAGFVQAHRQKLLLDAKVVYDANAPATEVNEPTGIE